jgi:hypothetical protein
MGAVTSALIAAGAVALNGSCPLPLSSAPQSEVSACLAAAPVGEPFAGNVLQVLDGRTICVAQGPAPSQWIKVRLADSDGAGDRSSLMAAAFAKRVVCVVLKADGAAHCALNGVSLVTLSQGGAARAEAAFWR